MNTHNKLLVEFMSAPELDFVPDELIVHQFSDGEVRGDQYVTSVTFLSRPLLTNEFVKWKD